MPEREGSASFQSKVLKNKFLRSQSERSKEIDEWARSGRKNVEFMRQSGQLTENVTEDLMLHEHLLELSKARYKFKVTNKFEKKIFLQRQMKKSAALNDALKHIDLDTVKPKWATDNLRTKGSANTKSKLSTPKTHSGNSPKKELTDSNIQPRPPPREKPESAPARRRPTLLDDASPPRPATRASYSVDSNRLSSAKSDRHSFFKTQPSIDMIKYESSHRGDSDTENNDNNADLEETHKNMTDENSLKGTLVGSRVTFKDRGSAIPPKTAPQPSGSTLNRRSSLKRHSMKKPSIAAWSKRNQAQYLEDERAPIRDLRYTELTSSLCSVYRGQPKTPEVNVIVSMISALHTSSHLQETRPKVTNKIKEYLMQAGLTAP